MRDERREFVRRVIDSKRRDGQFSQDEIRQIISEASEVFQEHIALIEDLFDERRGFDPHGGNFTQGYGRRDLDSGPWEPVKFWRTPIAWVAVAVNVAFLAALLWALLR